MGFFFAPSVQHLTGPLFGLALYRATQTIWPHLPLSLKAPNDLWLGSGKVAGLLIETIASGSNWLVMLASVSMFWIIPKTLPVLRTSPPMNPKCFSDGRSFCICF